MKVFLGGTCNNTIWREKLIPMLKINYFNPVVEDWTEECQKEEIRQREICDYCLYVITPSMQGVYSIAEVVSDSHIKPYGTIFCVLEHEIPTIANIDNIKVPMYPTSKTMFSEAEMKSLDAVGKLIEKNGSKYFKSLEEVAEYLNNNFMIETNNNVRINMKFRLNDKLAEMVPVCDCQHTISNINNDKVEISWVVDGKELKLEYKLKDVINSFEDGSWIKIND